jgi:5'-nucleotidase/UDP-sugar diphosphatase
MIRRFLTVFWVLGFCSLLAVSAVAQSTLTILHTNDTHSALFPFGPQDGLGGIGRASALIKGLKGQDRNVLVLNAGDVFVGSFEFNEYLGYPELSIMQGLYDAMGLGNHELDLGLDALAGVLSGQFAGGAPITMPILCANIDLAGHPALRNFIKPYLIKQVGGLKVGLIGVITTDKQNYSDEVAALLLDPYSAAGDAANTLKVDQKCDLVICLSHLGVMSDQLGLAQVPGIDIIVGGHSHTVLAEPIQENGKIIVQAGEFGKYLGELKVSVANGKVDLQKYTLYAINRKINTDPSLNATLNHLRSGIVVDPRFGPVFSKRIADAERDLEKTWEEGVPEKDTPLGNLVADALKTGLREKGFQADIGLEANGYIAHKIYKGEVVGNDVMRAVPYGYDPASGLGFKVDCVLLAGAQILAGLEYSVTYVEYTDELSMQVSGLKFSYDSSKPASPAIGELSRLDPASVLVNGQPIQPDGMYWVALNEQLLAFLKSNGLAPFQVLETGLFEYNLVRDFMHALDHVDYQIEGRIVDKAIIK